MPLSIIKHYVCLLIERQDMFKRAPKLSGVHVSSAESLERTWKTCQSLIRTWETRGTPSDREGPGGNVLASVVDLGPNGPNRTTPLSLRESTTCDPSRLVPHTMRCRERPLEKVARPWQKLKDGQNPTVHYVSGKRGRRSHREHSVNPAYVPLSTIN